MNDTAELDNEVQVPGQSDNDELHEEIMGNLKQGRQFLADWRQEARESRDFYAGNQWDEEDVLTLQEQQRPVVTFNRTKRTLDAVSGLEIQSRQEITALPRQIDDSGISEDMTHAFKFVREGCDAEDEESESFMDLGITGLAYLETRTDMDTDGAGSVKIIIDRVDPFEVLYDQDAKKANLVDAKWICRIKQFTKNEFKAEYPKAEFIPGNFWQSDIGGNDPHDATNAWRYENDRTDQLNHKKTTWVAQYQYWEKHSFYKVVSPDGKIVSLPEERYKAMRKGLEEMGIQAIEYKKKVYKECFLSPKDILFERDLGCPHFTIQALTGFRDANKNTWFGIVATMKDPQRWANKWLSQIQHILNTSAKNGYFVEEGAFKSPRKAEQELSKPGSLTHTNPGGNEKIREKIAPQYPQGIDRLLQYAMQSINDVTGINLELIGMAERDQPFVLEQSRKEAGVTILAPLFNSLRRYRKIEGRILAYFIRTYLPDGELIRIVGQDGAKYVPLMKDKLAFEYDIIVDDAPTSPNMKERIYPILNQSIQMALQAGIPIPPDVLDYAPLPSSLIQKWKQMIISSKQDPAADQMKQIKMMLAQLEVAQKQRDIQKTSSEVWLNYSKGEQAHATGQDEAAQAMQKMSVSNSELQIKHEQMLNEQAREDVKALLNERRKSLELQFKTQQQQQSNNNYN